MKTKSNAAKATKKNAATKKQNRAIPYQTIQKLAEQGLTAMAIAVKTDRVIPGADGSHSIRAILSKMRSSGWKNKDGKIIKLKVARVGAVKPTKKVAAKKNVVVMKKAAKKKAALPVDGKTAAAGGQ
jgi:hypothetical protein